MGEMKKHSQHWGNFQLDIYTLVNREGSKFSLKLSLLLPSLTNYPLSISSS